MNADHRAAQIAGLREAAQFLADNPDVPTNRYGDPLIYSGSSYIRTGDRDGMAELRRIARLLHVEITDVSGDPPGVNETHFYVRRQFSGGVRYEANYIRRQHMADVEVADKARDEAMAALLAARKGGAA